MRWQTKYSYVAFELAIVLQIITYILPLSIETKLLFFIASLAAFLYFRIDSRFFIVAALAHLWFCPFALAIKSNTIAETSAIYAFYYLVIGVIGQLIEQAREPHNVPFEPIMRDVMHLQGWKYLPVLAVIIQVIAYAVGASAFKITVFWYILSVALVFLALRWLLKEEREQHHYRHH